MTRRPVGARRGITLTEILISILIMGVGLISLATLFPLGMVRLRAAQQQSRSALLAESATADLGARSLLLKPSFLIAWYGTYDPFTQDGAGGLSASTFGTGLPICYDPLWRFETGVTPAVAEARFAAGVFPNGNSFLRADPGDSKPASGYGLQRITNFATTTGWPFVNPETVFVSPDDQVMQNSDAAPQLLTGPNGAGTSQGGLSGVVPQFFPQPNGSYVTQNDFRYTWMFTGYQADATNATAFVGDVVVMDGRPFGFGAVTSPVNSGQTQNVADGETVLEAIFGYSSNTGGNAVGYGVAADRTVLLRWPATMPDPEIRVGNWIADVTYERTALLGNPPGSSQVGSRVANTASGGVIYPFQRCYWYQIVKRQDVQADPDVAGFRRMVVQVGSPLKARTLLNQGGTVVNINVALFMPSVVNAFPRTIFVRTDR